MRKRTHTSRTLSQILILLLAVGLSLTACSKRLAELSLKSARKDVQAARSDEAEKFNPELLKQSEDLIEQTQNQLNQGSFDTARDTARNAKETAERLADKTKADRAQALKKAASEDVKVADINLGNQINQTLYEEIVELDNQADEALTKTKYEKTIDLCLQVRDKVSTLLQQLKSEAEDALRQRRNEFDTLLREGGRVEAPKYVAEAQKKIDDIDKLIKEDRNYRLAIQKTAELQTLIAQGITEAFRSRSKKKIDLLESKQTRAILEGAEKYNAEFLESTQEQYGRILANFYDEKFEQVLEAADLLEPRLDRLILETRIYASKDAMDQVRQAIRGLEADKVRQYLKGALEKIEKMLAKAESEFKQDLYDECKKTCQIALEEKEHVLKQFDTLAAKEIREASGMLSEAESLLKRMGEIFETQSPESPNSYEMTFEKSKQSLKATLENTAREAGVLLAAAGVQREDKQFSESIENARTVVRKANYVTQEVFHVVAHNNVLELAHRISQVEKNGGTQFAASELKDSQKELDKARKMIRGQEKKTSDDKIDPQAYRGAVTQTSEANASIETVMQKIIQAAAARIDQAEKAVAEAVSSQADVYALGELTTARGVLEQARKSFSGSRYRQSAQEAVQSRQLAVEAATKALKAWASQVIGEADSEYTRAEQANAAEYAGQLFQQAGDKLATARDLFQEASGQGTQPSATKTYRTSRELAAEAREDARAARMKPVTTANQAIVTAKRFGAWEYDYALVMNAVVNAREAIEAMQSGNFSVSKVYAEQATQLARQAADMAKQATYAERMAEVNAKLGHTADAGAALYMPDAMNDLINQLNFIRRQYSLDRFETVAAQISAIERNIFAVAQQTPKVFDALYASRQAFYEQLNAKGSRDFARRRMTDAERLLRHSRMDFDRGAYSNSFENLTGATRLLVSVQLEYDEREFATAIQNMVAQLMEAKKQVDPLLDISRPTLQYLLAKPNARDSTNALLMGANPVEFREAMDELYKRAIGTPYPVTMEDEHKELVDVMLLARRCGIQFEKVIILNHYDEETAWEIVDSAFGLMDQCMKAKNGLTKQFEHKGLQGNLATLEYVIGN